MRLRRLEVRGFKSFADRTEFDFDADLTGIVGPNGCGKSNVVDALKWVLGDQRAKSLRGAEMTDVIFKGAEGRDGLPFAEVTVHLEDENGGLGGRTRVSIGRRLTRDKESDYMVDGQPVRLKDVRDLLLDTGLGVGAYSVMEQGRIDAVLSANPESRRAIFEEAAGISKFKLQKRESLRKLERTEQNLARVKDLLEERARRIRSLRIQAGRARRYRELRASLRDIKAALAVLDGRALRATADELRAGIGALEQRAAELEAAQQAEAARLEEQDAAIAAVAERVETAQEELRVARSRRDQLAGQREALGRRIEELEIDAAGCVERFEELEQQRAGRRAELEAARVEIARLEQAVIDLHRAQEEHQETSRAASREVRALQEARERAREQMLETLHLRTRNRNAAHDQEVQKRTAAAALARLDVRLRDLDLDRATLRAEIDGRRVELESLEERMGDAARREQAALGELEHADRAVAGLARRESHKREELASVRSRLEVLEGMETHHEGLDQGPRHLLETMPAGLRGRLLDELEVSLEDSRALEAALGPYVQALVADTRANAEAMLALLEREGKGRALLLVQDEAGAAGPRGDAPSGAIPLLDVLVVDDAIRPLVAWILRDVYLVEGFEAEPAAHRDACLVTRDGRLRRGPRFEGGSVEGQGGLVVRRAQIQALGEESDLIERDLAALRADLELGMERVAALGDNVRTVGSERTELREREQHARSAIGHTESRLADLERQRQTVELERHDAAKHRVQALARLGDLLLEGLLIARSEGRDEAAEAKIRADLEEAQRHAAECAAAEQEIRVQHAASKSEREARAHRLETLEQSLVDLDRASVDLEERRSRALAGVAEAKTEAGAAAAAIAAADEAIEQLGRIADERRVELERARADKAALVAAHRDTELARDQARDELGQRRLELADAEHKFARLEERLHEEAGIALRRCLGLVHGLGILIRVPFGPPCDGSVPVLLGPPLPDALTADERGLVHLWEREDFDPPGARKEEKVLQSQLDRLGAVNLDAVEELEEEEGAFDQLERDVEDLTASRKSLIEALRQMEAESRALFQKTFEEARENFRTIFRKLFQGGRADMYLHDNEDALESGIEIVAKPPGKELQSIGLLSGGERSLTALAILFAVFKVKPSPFCILDEVDAALDDTNVERFLRVLNDFVGPSQFCIVTHHKRTMAACQKLYGITMQRRGVSTRLSVTLAEVDEFAETAAGPDPARKQRIAGEEQIGF